MTTALLNAAKDKLFLAKHTTRKNWQDWYALMDESFTYMREALAHATTPKQRAACNAMAADILAAYRDR